MLGAGILLQRAVRAGAAVLPVFLTSGEGNTWPLRVLERTLWVTAAHRARFAARRERETAAALAVLGYHAAGAVFLRWPDTRLAPLALQEPQPLLSHLRELFAAFRPTHVLCPVLADRHPDHSAAAVLVLAAAEGVAAELLGYATHTPLRERAAAAVLRLAGNGQERATKARAIACHESQMVFRHRFHRSFARGEELFFPVDAPEPRPRLRATLAGQELAVGFSLPPSWRTLRPGRLELFWYEQTLFATTLRLPCWPRGRRMQQTPGGELALELAGFPWGGKLSVRFPCRPRWVAVKVHRLLLLFQEVGFTLVRNAGG